MTHGSGELNGSDSVAGPFPKATHSRDRVLPSWPCSFCSGHSPQPQPFFRMNVAAYRYLHLYLHLLPDVRVPKDSYTGGYFAFFLPAIALTVCIWTLLRLFSRSGLTHRLLRSVGGITALAAGPVWWLLSVYSANRRYGWSPFAAIQYELVLILLCAVLYLAGRWAIPTCSDGPGD